MKRLDLCKMWMIDKFSDVEAGAAIEIDQGHITLMDQNA